METAIGPARHGRAFVWGSVTIRIEKVQLGKFQRDEVSGLETTPALLLYPTAQLAMPTRYHFIPQAVTNT